MPVFHLNEEKNIKKNLYSISKMPTLYFSVGFEQLKHWLLVKMSFWVLGNFNFDFLQFCVHQNPPTLPI